MVGVRCGFTNDIGQQRRVKNINAWSSSSTSDVSRSQSCKIVARMGDEEGSVLSVSNQGVRDK